MIIIISILNFLDKVSTMKSFAYTGSQFSSRLQIDTSNWRCTYHLGTGNILLHGRVFEFLFHHLFSLTTHFLMIRRLASSVQVDMTKRIRGNKGY